MVKCPSRDTEGLLNMLWMAGSPDISAFNYSGCRAKSIKGSLYRILQKLEYVLQVQAFPDPKKPALVIFRAFGQVDVDDEERHGEKLGGSVFCTVNRIRTLSEGVFPKDPVRPHRFLKCHGGYEKSSAGA